jgi:ABC-type transport system involved in cytochrome c biogenesis permease subunit
VAVVVVSLLVHTFGILSRMYISGRPPVTNLYSSAVFIGWGAVLLGLVLEAIYKNTVGLTLATVAGFLSLLVAGGFAATDAAKGEADTMAQLQAVLDTNFWLATHVVCISIGYLATFAAGLLGIVYVIRGVFTSSLSDPADRKDMARMVYGTVCFAMFFSFVGTILGGIWADQSWGRFWGWDPKENGAILIVLWNAAILHARWCGLIKVRGLMLWAIIGNIVTAWSWVGTNMLGVGLHSYGFMGAAGFTLLMFVIGMVMLVAVGNLPLSAWKSFAEEERNGAPAAA